MSKTERRAEQNGTSLESGGWGTGGVRLEGIASEYGGRFGANDAEGDARCDGGSDYLCIAGLIGSIADPVKRMLVGITVGRTSYFIFLLY